MTEPTAEKSWHDSGDLTLLEEAVEQVRSGSPDRVLATLAPGLFAEELASLAAHCVLAHAAVLVFPPTQAALVRALRERGATPGEALPSVVVRDRLAARYGTRPGDLSVSIVRAAVETDEGGRGEIEVFVLPAARGGEFDHLAARERDERNESHLALAITSSDDVVLAGLLATLTGRGGMRVDGGGHNPYEDVTVFYLSAGTKVAPADGTRTPSYGRLELQARGHRPRLLAAHLAKAPEEPAKKVLRVITGAWRTQAVATAAELALFDHVRVPEEGPATGVEELAERTGTDRDSLARLLRYLAELELVATDAGGYRLTGAGALLRTGAEHSMRPLALLYGGPFYESFGELSHSVRTGGDAFARRFGAHHFAYFAGHPVWNGLFDRAMAATAPMFAPVAEALDRAGTDLVVDVAGGNGELLALVLGKVPGLRGVLLERAHAVEAARSRLEAEGCADRCAFVVGDFTREVPGGGDAYLLSRVLHDWDDERCLAILRRCADAMPDHAELFVLERLLPEEGETSLAVSWDVHMLCNVGGRERTLDQYRSLLARTGFTLSEVRALPLDGSLLRARLGARNPGAGPVSATATGRGEQ
ncbi:methyltransferase [Streptomyces tsukubensis]|uniref:Methyltransferase n=1 Tax=Streptomyces tsukubensis TaxID=83656 RepID=A0A1V4AFY4_9ACTN|nr:methyltransferase [Streptomyces tsukubensis]OON82936.1 hypothetical protein B1H18_02710 [Streptomyces tsukubensis]QFR91878.1 hypothetical protein GBW32_00970 [Streptomyces tsukubensis]